MSFSKKFNGAQIPLILTVLLVVGTAWSWVIEMNRTETSEDVQTRLANFALDGEDKSGETSLPACCMTLDQADTAEVSLVASKNASCEGCPGSGTSKSVADGGDPACCPGSTSSVADGKKNSDSPCCASSSTSTAKSEEEKPACCPGSSSSKNSVADTSELDPETEAMIATVKIPQVEE